MDELRKITTELAKVEEGKVKAIAEGDRVYLMIQDAPSELRKLADAGVRGILNFAPTRLEVPATVCVHPVDLALQLEQLAFRMRVEGHQEPAGEPRPPRVAGD